MMKHVMISPDGQAAIDDDILARNIRRRLRRQKHNGSAHFIAFGHAPHGDAVAVTPDKHIILTAEHTARTDGIYPDSLVAPVARQILGQPPERGFADAVDRGS